MSRILLMAAALATVSHHAFAVIAVDVGDAYTQEAFPTTTSGTAPALVVSGSGSGNFTRSWIQFNFRDVLPPDTSATQLTKATLKLWVSSLTTSGSVNIFQYIYPNFMWSELTLTDLGAPHFYPGLTAVKGSFSVTPATAGNFVLIDVTSMVKSWMWNGSQWKHSIILVPADSNVNVAFDSKESTATSHEPQLAIELTAFAGDGSNVTNINPASIAGLPNDNGYAILGDGHWEHLQMLYNATDSSASASFGWWNMNPNGASWYTNLADLSGGSTDSIDNWRISYTDGSATFGQNNVYLGTGGGGPNNASSIASMYGLSQVFLSSANSYGWDWGGIAMLIWHFLEMDLKLILLWGSPFKIFPIWVMQECVELQLEQPRILYLLIVRFSLNITEPPFQLLPLVIYGLTLGQHSQMTM